MSDETEREATGVVISGSLMDRLMSLPDVTIGAPGHAWTEEEDKALMAAWPVKLKREVAQEFGLSPNTCRDRYNILMRGTT